MASFGDKVREAFAAKASAAEVLRAAEGFAGQEEVDAARAVGAEAEARLAVLLEEAALYAEEHHSLALEFEALASERDEARLRAEAAERSSDALRQTLADLAAWRAAAETRERDLADAAEGALRKTELAKHEYKASRKREAAAVEAERACHQRVSTLERRLAESERDRLAASSTAEREAAASAADALSAREALAAAEAHLTAFRATVEADLRAVKLAAESEVHEASRDKEVHLQRRLAAKSELVSVVRALEGARHVEQLTERNCREKLAPKLQSHHTQLADVVQHLITMTSKLGVAATRPLDPQRSPTERTVAHEQHASARPPPYIGQLAGEVERVDAGLALLQQALNVLEDAIEERNRMSLCAALRRALTPSSSSTSSTARAPSRRPAAQSELPPRTKREKGGYLRVDPDVQEI